MTRGRSPSETPTPSTSEAPIPHQEARRANGDSSKTRRDLVEDAILQQAAEIFASRGVQGTGIREIAEALDMSRPAVYHYFSSKEKILERLLEGYTSALTGFFREVRYDTSRKPLARLREMVKGLALRVIEKPAYLRLLSNSEPDLPEPLAAAHRRSRHEAMEHMTSVIAEAVEAGDARPVDERIAAFTLFGMAHWIAWWYRPGGPASAEAIAEEMADFAVAGLARPDTRRAGGMQQAIELLREDLSYLERLAGISR